MKIALVHDYLNEYGGAERVLETLAGMYPTAPIYTAFAVPGSSALEAFKNKTIITSWFQKVPFYKKLYSPLRFLIPWIWKSFDFSDFDLVITSASWYITKGMRRGNAKEVCYCHTPPRWLYGYETSINWKKWWIVRVYALITGHFLRMYDFEQAQKVDVFLANSVNVKNRIAKFYRRESIVIYPPVPHLPTAPSPKLGEGNRKEYFLMVTRIVGGKGIELAVEAAIKSGFKLVIAGEKAGYSSVLSTQGSVLKNVEFVGRVSEEEKYRLMANAKAFLALSKDEDLGITPIEAQSVGTPVIAFNGGGYRETVIHKKTGILFDEYNVDGLVGAVREFGAFRWNKNVIMKNAERFSEDRFIKEMNKVVESVYARAAGN
jgi:glycosyltransferase involved in cell wall biosynthesis